MPHPMKLIFIQLPRLDPDVASPGENNMAAAACLRAALARSDEASHWIVCETLDVQDAASDARLLERIVDAAPDAVAATCYLWNVERTLSLWRRLKRRVPGLRAVLGGPDIARDHPVLADAKPRRGALWDVPVVGEG